MALNPNDSRLGQIISYNPYAVRWDWDGNQADRLVPMVSIRSRDVILEDTSELTSSWGSAMPEFHVIAAIDHYRNGVFDT